MKEHALFLGKTQPVVGVVTEPSASKSGVGIILSNSGVIHRVGPSRAYVKIARRLASIGFVAARIDHRGLGDSPARTDTVPFMEAALQEVVEVMDDMGERWGVRRFLVGGICLGAELAFRAAKIDDRIAGVLLINGVGYEEDTEWKTYAATQLHARDYVRRASLNGNSWRRALTGKINYRRLTSVLWRYGKSVVRPSKAVSEVVERLSLEFSTLAQGGVGTLWVHSSDDATIEFRRLVFGDVEKRTGSTQRLRSVVIPEADHTFTLLASQEQLVQTIEEWALPFLQGQVPGPEQRARSGSVEA